MSDEQVFDAADDDAELFPCPDDDHDYEDGYCLVCGETQPPLVCSECGAETTTRCECGG